MEKNIKKVKIWVNMASRMWFVRTENNECAPNTNSFVQEQFLKNVWCCDQYFVVTWEGGGGTHKNLSTFLLGGGGDRKKWKFSFKFSAPLS